MLNLGLLDFLLERPWKGLFRDENRYFLGLLVVATPRKDGGRGYSLPGLGSDDQEPQLQ